MSRRMFGGRKLWDPKDERAWVHDRFEEMNLQDAQYDEVCCDRVFLWHSSHFHFIQPVIM